MEIAICPLCGLGSHPGKCGRLSKGRWWCGPCLVTKLSKAELDAPGLPIAFILAAEVRRTSKWCMKCGVPLCPTHRLRNSTYTKENARCYPDCLDRTPQAFTQLRRALEYFVPDYLTAGPTRCRVCSVPAYRKSLCNRHYGEVRRGKTELTVHRTRRRKGYKRIITHCYLRAETKALAKQLADKHEQTIAEWIVGLIHERIKSELGVDPDLAETIWAI